MDKAARLADNINKLSKITPDIALRLQYHDTSDTEYAQTRKGEENLLKDGRPVHSNYSAEKEAQKWFASLDLDGVDVVYVYGVGLGYYYDALKPWLEEHPHHYAVFLEDDMSILTRLLETERGSRILDDKQVQLHYFHDFQQGNAMFEWVTWYFVGLHPEVTALDMYHREKAQQTVELKRKLLHSLVSKEAAIGEYMRFGASFYHNYYANALHLPQAYHANKLFGKFKGVPAIICGAGPSLNKNFDVLRTLGDRALILAGGSSLNALSKKDFLPHFAGGIDPNLPQYERLMSNHAFEVPFFYRGRMHHKAFDTIHGPRLYVNGTGGYFVSDWLEHKLGIADDTFVDEGHNVINFLVYVAMKLGCSPIILVGMDLAFTGMQSYASGVVGDASVKEDEILDARDLESGAFLREDIHGKPLYTLWKWVKESQWVSEFAEEFKEDTQLINATEGGLGFEGIPNMTLEEVAKRYLKTPEDLYGRVHTEINEADLPEVSLDKVVESLAELRQGLEECIEYCDGFCDEIDKMENLVKKGKSTPPNLQTGKAAFYDVELKQHPIFQCVLSPLCATKAKMLERRGHQIRYDWSLRSERERKLEQLKLNREKTLFVAQAARVNLQILDEVMTRHQEDTHQDLSAYFNAHKEKV